MKNKKISDLLEGEVIADNIYRSNDAKSASTEIPVVSAGVKLTSSIINKLSSLFGPDYKIVVREIGAAKKPIEKGNGINAEAKPSLPKTDKEAERKINNGIVDFEAAIQMYGEAFKDKEKYNYTRDKLVQVFEKIDGVMQDFQTTKQLNEQTLTAVSSDLTSVLRKPDSNFDPSLVYVVEMESWDEVTFNHSFDVAVIALTFASAFTSDKSELASIFLAGLLHDIGKYLYSKFQLNEMDYIIKKAGKLTDDEFKQIKKHVDVEDFLFKCFSGLDERFRQNIIYGASEHHEKFSGGGYIKNKKGMEISFAGRLIAICDVYDALLRERRYKNAMKPNLVMDFINKLTQKGQFDPLMFKKFIRTFGRYPVGSVLKTNIGTGVVVEQTNDFERPILFLPDRGEINLIKNTSVEIQSEAVVKN